MKRLFLFLYIWRSVGAMDQVALTSRDGAILRVPLAVAAQSEMIRSSVEDTLRQREKGEAALIPLPFDKSKMKRLIALFKRADVLKTVSSLQHHFGLIPTFLVIEQLLCAHYVNAPVLLRAFCRELVRRMSAVITYEELKPQLPYDKSVEFEMAKQYFFLNGQPVAHNVLATWGARHEMGVQDLLDNDRLKKTDTVSLNMFASSDRARYSLLMNNKGLTHLSGLGGLMWDWLKGKYDKIVSIELRDNFLTTPIQLHSFMQVTSLYLSNNHLATTDGIEQLMHLNDLSLDYNRLRSCVGLVALKQLTYLDLTGNKLKQCSSLRHLDALEELHIGSNWLAWYKVRRLQRQLPYTDIYR